jgi:hypothetical protein
VCFSDGRDRVTESSGLDGSTGVGDDGAVSAPNVSRRCCRVLAGYQVIDMRNIPHCRQQSLALHMPLQKPCTPTADQEPGEL